MNLGIIWDQFTQDERLIMHQSVLYYANNIIHTLEEPKHINVPFNKLIFLKIPYVLNTMKYYRNSIAMNSSKMYKAHDIIKKLKGMPHESR